MSDRVDQKLEQVAVAHYAYRHEAEFAAGFLDDAGIGYRLQVDDPGLGMPLSSSAVIWVLAMDADRVRDILEIDEPSPRLPVQRSFHPARPARPARSARAWTHAFAGAPLTLRERILSIVTGMGLATIGRAFLSGAGYPILQVGVGGAAIVLILSGAIGRAPRALRDLLSAMSGAAP